MFVHGINTKNWSMVVPMVPRLCSIYTSICRPLRCTMQCRQMSNEKFGRHTLQTRTIDAAHSPPHRPVSFSIESIVHDIMCVVAYLPYAISTTIALSIQTLQISPIEIACCIGSMHDELCLFRKLICNSGVHSLRLCVVFRDFLHSAVRSLASSGQNVLLLLWLPFPTNGCS